MITNRFVVVGDMHKNLTNTNSTDQVGVDYRYGPPLEPVLFDERFNLLLQNLKREKDTKGLDFVLFNGDIIVDSYTDKVSPLTEVRDAFTSQVGVPIYASVGNHDKTTDEQWETVFGHERDHAFSVGDYGFVIIETTNIWGHRQVLSDAAFIDAKFQELSDKKGVFVFAHIPRYSGIRPDVLEYDSPNDTATLALFEQQPNLKGVFHSHFHEEDRMFEKNGVNYLFTGHVANYGINYYGYRIVEMHDDGLIVSYQYDMTNSKIRYTNVIEGELPSEPEPPTLPEMPDYTNLAVLNNIKPVVPFDGKLIDTLSMYTKIEGYNTKVIKIFARHHLIEGGELPELEPPISDDK